MLKLHRNRYFAGDLDAWPASILVTTLAAHAYEGERDLHDAVLEIVERMPLFVETTANGPCVPNPVEPRENFADAWRKRPEVVERFTEWLDRLDEDLRDAGSRRGLDRVAARLSEGFGEEPVETAASKLGDTYRRERERGRLSFAPASGLLTTGAGIRVPDHDFHGAAVRP